MDEKNSAMRETESAAARIGFAGIGHMGLPMAANLLRAGIPLLIWSRRPGSSEALLALGARRAENIDALCRQVDVLLLMLLDETAVDAVLGRGTPAFRERVAGKTVVQLGTTSAGFSQVLHGAIVENGGAYVEAPVSGSRVPAEQGRLVGMVAGADEAVQRVLPLLAPLCTRVFRCGAVPGALRMKLAANHYLIGMVTVLAETVHAARAAGVDLELLQQVLDAGPMASDVSRIKLAKLVHADFSPQAAIRDVGTIAQLVLDQVAAAGADTPLIRHCVDLYRAAEAAGHGEDDMAAVVRAFAPALPMPAADVEDAPGG